MTGDGSPAAGGGGGTLAPFVILLVVAALQFLDRFLQLLKKRGSTSEEQLKLQHEIKQLKREASSLSTPSTFAQAALLRRSAAAKEKELVKRQEEDSKGKNLINDKYARILTVSKVVTYTLLIWWFWSVPVASVPKNLLQPFGRVFSWRAGDTISGHVVVGIIPWLIVTSRVSKFLCMKIPAKFFQF